MLEWENGRYLEEIREMWQNNFHDPVLYTQFYFEEVYGKNRILVNKDSEDNMRGMLHLNPYTLKVDGRPVSAHYIVGVATNEEYRRQGVMRELLKETFSYLRNQGEAFTYLMPADEAYYLPFDFRFGMVQKEQELEYCPLTEEKNEESYSFCPEPKEFQAVCDAENAMRDACYRIHTGISEDYLSRLGKEAKSDFARLLYVYKEDNYVGRFILGAENDYMVVSQIVCLSQELRNEFLGEVIKYAQSQYHYGKYQLILDETWEPVKRGTGMIDFNHILPAKEKKIIMFRLLNLEKMGEYLKSSEAHHAFLYVKDAYLSGQQGAYEWICDGSGCKITKVSEKQPEDCDGGEITVADLTGLLFGGLPGEETDRAEELTEKGLALLRSIVPLRPVCIQEIV